MRSFIKVNIRGNSPKRRTQIPRNLNLVNVSRRGYYNFTLVEPWVEKIKIKPNGIFSII